MNVIYRRNWRVSKFPWWGHAPYIGVYGEAVLFYLGLFSFITALKIKPTFFCQELDFLWPLDRGDKNGKTLVGTAKRWPRSLNRGVRFNRGLISHSLLQLFRGIDYWPLNGGWLLNRCWPLNEVQLCTEWDDILHDEYYHEKIPLRSERL